MMNLFRTLARRLILLLAIVSVPYSCLASDIDASVEQPTGDLGRIQGTWNCTIFDTLPVTLVIKEDRGTLQVEFPGGELVTYKGKVVLNGSTEPKQLDFVDYRGPDGEEMPDNLGIYRFEEDRFILCNRTRDYTRPERFTLGNNGYPLLQVYTRAKREN